MSSPGWLLALFMLPLTSMVAAAETRLQADPSAPLDEQQFAALVVARSEAIDAEFGALFEGSTGDIRIEFVTAGDMSSAETMTAYDPARNALMFRRVLLHKMSRSVLPPMPKYWTYYERPQLRADFPLIMIVDEALWHAHLAEAADRQGLKWPDASCASSDFAERLGCEMLVAGIYETLRSSRASIFNANRIDRLWPENLSELERRAGKRDHPEYLAVRRLGGACIVRPLIEEFGVPRVFAYVAQTPFRIENGNVRVSALRYQERARKALAW